MTLWRLDRSALDSDDVASLLWIIEQVGRGAALERIDGNLSAVGHAVGVTTGGGEDLPTTPTLAWSACTSGLSLVSCA
jgi:hypothetical protein